MRAHREALLVWLLVGLSGPAIARDQLPSEGWGRREAALRHGLEYLRGHRSDPSALIVLDYLQRKYDLEDDLTFARTSRATAASLGLWGRFVGPAPGVDRAALRALEATGSTDHIVMPALYCDRVPFGNDDLETLERSVAQGGYQLTHAVLALKLLHDHRCPAPSKRLRQITEAARRALLTGLEQPPADPRYDERDIRYEGLAVLADLLGEREIPETLFAQLLAEQQPDGGWRPQPDRPSHPHSTVVAVWALLARQHPQAPPIEFARRRPPGGRRPPGMATGPYGQPLSGK